MYAPKCHIKPPALPTLDPDKVSPVIQENHFSSTWYMALDLKVEQERIRRIAAFNRPN